MRGGHTWRFDSIRLKDKPPGACTWKIALKYKVKQSQNGKFPSNYKAGPIHFETQISLRR